MDTELLFNEHCVNGMRNHVKDNSIDLIFTDPPYGIDGANLHKHYARKEEKVVPGYVDVPRDQYQQFSHDWINECARVLRPGGSFYVVSGYTCLYEILHALRQTGLVEVNHLIWKFNFSVYTEKKWASTHYHILYWVKPPLLKKTFNTYCRFTEKTDSYHDREDVIEVNRDYKPGEIKNKNQLPEELVERFILYSSNEGDTVLDPFLGGFTTAMVSLTYGRKIVGFEMNKAAFDVFLPKLQDVAKRSFVPQKPDEAELRRRLKMREERNQKRKHTIDCELIEMPTRARAA